MQSSNLCFFCPIRTHEPLERLDSTFDLDSLVEAVLKNLNLVCLQLYIESCTPKLDILQ